MNQQLQDVIEYLGEENPVLREQLPGRRLRPTDNQPRRPAVRAKTITSNLLREMATIVTPEILLAWRQR